MTIRIIHVALMIERRFSRAALANGPNASVIMVREIAMAELLQDVLNALNANVFYREFSFSKNVFYPRRGQTEEFADHAIWIDDILIIFQVKERNTGQSSEEMDRRWFQNKVLAKATRQVRNTLGFLKDYPEINIKNQREHVFNVSGASLKHIIKLVIYKPPDEFPRDLLRVRHHVSSTAGFMHVIPWDDYANLCATLITPAELVEYFEFREKVIKKWFPTGQVPSEPALVGQFLRNEDDSVPSEEYARYVFTLKQDFEDFDIFNFLSGIGSRVAYYEGMDNELGYYNILAEFAKLSRADLKLAKERIVRCEEAARANREFGPFRFSSRQTGCGFVFMAFDEEGFDSRIEMLKVLTEHSKYQLRLSRHVGVSFAKHGNVMDINWALMSFPWQPDPMLEANLKNFDPFPPLRSAVRARYSFEEMEK